MNTATIIDAGVGNLGNLARAVESLGHGMEVTRDPSRVAQAHCLMLPGVGAFRPPRERLRGELEGALRSALDEGAWLLGICVGFQLLFESSQEFGTTDGLGLLRGEISSLPADVSLPHIGWNPLHGVEDHPLLDGISDGGHVYFVHSFAPLGTLEEETLAQCTHGRTFAAVSARERVMGTQFHPEKSGALGLRLLANFLEISHGTDSVD